MKFKLISPFRCHFNVKTSKKMANRDEYSEFWNEVSNFFKDNSTYVHKLTFPHKTEQKSNLVYSRLREHSFTETINFKPGELSIPYIQETNSKLLNQNIQPFFALSPFEIDPSSVNIRIYDNTVGIFEAYVTVNESLIDSHFEDLLTYIQLWTELTMNIYLPLCYNKLILPLIEEIWTIDNSNKFLQTRGETTFYVDLNGTYNKRQKYPVNTTNNYFVYGSPLWLSRTLYHNKITESQLNYTINKWLIINDDLKTSLLNQFKTQPEIYIGLRHNLITRQYDEQIVDDAIEAIILCQYFYTVLDYTEFKLSETLGLTTENISIKKIKATSITLRETIATIKLLLFQLNDMNLNIDGNKEYFVNTLKRIWTMDILINNVKDKLEFCDNQLKYLHQRISSRSKIISEWLLFAIGGIALIDFIANLSSIALSLTPSYEVASNESMTPGLLSIALLYEPNILLWGGIIVLLAALTFYTYIISRSE